VQAVCLAALLRAQAGPEKVEAKNVAYVGAAERFEEGSQIIASYELFPVHVFKITITYL
jgi:hypothetical protein